MKYFSDIFFRSQAKIFPKITRFYTFFLTKKFQMIHF